MPFYRMVHRTIPSFATPMWPPERPFNIQRTSSINSPVATRSQEEASGKIDKKVMDDADNSNLWTNFSGIRQRSDKSLFEFSNVILWNVYNPEGVRVGQSAVFDKDKIEEVEKL